MKKEQAKQFLFDYLLKEDKFIIHSDFLGDFMQLLKNLSGQEKEIFNLLQKQLSYVLELDQYALSKANTNEILKYCTGFQCYSLHMQSKSFNIRLLGTFINGKFAFLVAFDEKSGKRRTDYTGQIELATQRLNELNSEMEDNYDE